jgi:hypothetical protein
VTNMPPLDASAFADSPPPSTIQPNPDYVPAYIAAPAVWVYDIDQTNGSSRASYMGEAFVGGTAAGNQVATKADIAAATTGVSTFNTRSGAVVLTTADVTGAGGAPQASPTFSGVPNAPTAAPGTNTTQLATCMFVTAAIGNVTGAMVASFNGRIGAVSLTASDITTAGGALTLSPAFTGTPTTPTATAGTATSQIASTMFVANSIANAVVSWNGRTGAVSLSLSDVTSVGGAPIASPNFTGTPSGPTPTVGDASTRLATTAFVTNAITGATTGVASFNTRTGAVTLQLADVTTVGGAPITSPNFAGTPSAPTPTAGDSSTKVATTAFVATAIGSMAPVVTQWNGRTGSVSLQLTDVTSVGGAPLASPTFTGTPAGPTPTAGDNSTRVATTAFVATAVPLASSTAPVMDSAAAVGAAITWARADHVHPSDTSRLPLIGGNLSGPLGVGGNGISYTIAPGHTIGFGWNNTNVVAYVDGGNQGPLAFNSALANYLPTSGGTINGALNVSGGQVNFTPSAGPTPFSITTPAGQYCRIGTTVTGVRAWATGTDAGNGSFAVWDLTSSVVRLQIDSNGGCSNTTGTWAAFSDARLKQDVTDYAGGLAEIIRLRPRSYRRIERVEADPEAPYEVGIVGQEIETVMPETITLAAMEHGGRQYEDLRRYQSAPVLYALVNAVRELAEMNATLRERVEALEARAADAAATRH